MENEKFIEVRIHLKESTLQTIENIVNYENTKIRLFNKNKPYITIEDFIVGCCSEIIKKLTTYDEHITFGNNANTSQFKLKNKIKDILKERNIKQLDLAEITGLDKATINLIVNNRTVPTLEAFLKISAALDFPPVEEMLERTLETD